MSRFESFELTSFNLEGRINLPEQFGLITILKSDDGKIVLVRSGEYVSVTEPVPATRTNLEAVLGFVLDIGIRRERQLTLGGGFYTGELAHAQSMKIVKQSDFDRPLFEHIKASLDAYYQSGDTAKESIAITTNYLIEAYNNARLLYPNFVNDSYLGLMRIIEATAAARGADGFGLAAARGVSGVESGNIRQGIPNCRVSYALSGRCDGIQEAHRNQCERQ